MKKNSVNKVNGSETQNELNCFNQSIKVEVSVDSIAANLLTQFSDDSPCAIGLVNTIIGRALANDVRVLVLSLRLTRIGIGVH
jgi:hypothetical protein